MAQEPFFSIGQRLSSDRYEIRSRLGKGGMAVVYLAHDRRLQTEVAVKVPLEALLEEEEFAQRFSREIWSLVRLSHPHVCRVIDVGEHEGFPFVVLQYLSGGCLEDRRVRERNGQPQPVTVESVREWLPSIASALDFVHSKGFVHRDVKPGNIMFDEHGYSYLGDFGVAKKLVAEGMRTTPALTGSGIVMGTPEYMAPELILGEAVDGRVDQYALAVTVFELLSGRFPFAGATPAAVIVQQTSQEPPSLRRFRSDIPTAFAEAVHKAMSRNATHRFPTCKAFTEAIIDSVAAVVRVPAVASGSTFSEASRPNWLPPKRPDRPETSPPKSPNPPDTAANAAIGTPATGSKRVATDGATLWECYNCGQKFRISPELAGKTVKCPKCASSFQLPWLDSTNASDFQPSVQSNEISNQQASERDFTQPLIVSIEELTGAASTSTPSRGSSSDPAVEFDGALCASCGTANQLHRKFCSRCGGKLTEPCLNEKCNVSISSGERFCPNCGADIVRLAALRTDQFERWSVELTEALEKYQFKHAAKLAKQLQQDQHPRFRIFRAKGEVFARDVERQQKTTEALVRRASETASGLLANDAVDEALQQLEQIPIEMMDFRLTLLFDSPRKLKNRIEARKKELQRQHEDSLRNTKELITRLLIEAEQLSQHFEFEKGLRILREITVPAASDLSDQMALVAAAIDKLEREQSIAQASCDSKLIIARGLNEKRYFSDARAVLEEIPESLRNQDILLLIAEVRRQEQNLVRILTSIASLRTSIEARRSLRDYPAALKLLRDFVNSYDREIVKEPQVARMIHEIVRLQDVLESENREYSEKCRHDLEKVAKDIATENWRLAIDTLSGIPTVYRDYSWKQLQERLVKQAFDAAQRLSRQSRYSSSAELLTQIHEVAESNNLPPKDRILQLAQRQNALHVEATRLLGFWKESNVALLKQMPYSQSTVAALCRLQELFQEHKDRRKWQKLCTLIKRKESNRLVKEAIAAAIEDITEESPDAMSFFVRAKELDPANANAFRECAKYCHDAKMAFQNAITATKLDAGDSRNWLLRGQLCLPRAPAKALSDFSKAVEVAKDLAQRLPAQSFRAEAHAQLGNYEAAIKDVEFCLSKTKDVLLIEQRARIYAMFRRYDEAIADNIEAEKLHRNAGRRSEAEVLRELNKRLKLLKRNGSAG